MTSNKPNHIILKEVSFSLLTEGTSLRIRADGYSMFPAIRPGNIVVIDPVPVPSVLTPSDIIAYRRESGFVVHRLTGTRQAEGTTLYVTRGDSCRYEDKPIRAGDIAGIVTAIETRKGAVHPTRHRICYLRNRLIVKIIHVCNKLFRIFRVNSHNS